MNCPCCGRWIFMGSQIWEVNGKEYAQCCLDEAVAEINKQISRLQLKKAELEFEAKYGEYPGLR